MRIGIVGSRSFADYRTFKKTLESYIAEYKWKNIELVSGGASGADSMAERYAKENGLSITIFYPNWLKYPKQAGMIRNHEIVKKCEVLIAFWDKKSLGTKHSLNLAHKYGRETIINYVS